MIHLLLRYIGIKTKLLDHIKTEVSNITPEGCGVLDMFAGSNVVGQSLLDKFNVYSNDVQNYSYIAAKLLIEVNGSFDYKQIDYNKVLSSTYFKNNFEYLNSALSCALDYESALFERTGKNISEDSTLKEFKFYYENSPYVGHFDKNTIPKCFDSLQSFFSKSQYNEAKKKNNFYSLFSRAYATPYFSLNQAVFFDSFRYAIDKMVQNHEICKTEFNAYLCMLMYLLENTVTSVGDHFAQPQKFKISDEARLQREVKKILSKKTINMHSVLKNINEQIREIKSTKYSTLNKAFCCDYKDLFLPKYNEYMKQIKTIYIDPPYTNAHYSRFYHILETVVLYDYPEIEFFGRYRTDRYQSPFCIRSEAINAFKEMISLCKENGKNLVISYSDTSQCILTKAEVINIVKEKYVDTEIKEIDYLYRNFGQKPNKVKGNELLIICKTNG